MMHVVMLAFLCGCAGGTVSPATDWRLVDYTLDSLGFTESGRAASSHAMLSAPGGRTVIFERNAIDVFGSGGSLTARLGGQGAGPGEFQLIARVGRITDSRLWIADTRLSRVTVLDLDSLKLRGKHYPRSTSKAEGAVFNWSLPVAVDSAGRYMVPGVSVGGSRLPGSTNPDAAPNVVGWQPADDNHPAIVAVSHSSPECVVEIEGQRFDVPECPKQRRAVSPAGQLVAVAIPVRDDAVDTYRFVMLKSNGDSVYNVTHRLTGLTRQEVVDSGLDDPFARYDARPEFIPRPTRLAVMDYMSLGDDGSLWIRGIIRQGRQAWHILDPNGQPYAMLWIPEEIWIDDVSADQALATFDRADGSIALYRIRIVRRNV